MNVKGFSYRMALSLLLVAGMEASCTMYYVEEPVTNQRGAKEGADGLSLALSVTSNNMPRTKMQDDVTQSANTGSGAPTAFRGLQDVHILPFRHAGAGGKESPVQGADRVNSEELELPYTGISNTFTNANWTAAKANGGLVANNFGHLYEHVSVPSGTASVTVYAKATEAAEPTDADALRTHRKTYGALTDKFSTAIESAGDVTFQPVPIMETAALTELRANAQTVADFLTEVAKSSVSLTGWYQTGWVGRTQRTDKWAWNGNEINGTFQYFTNVGEPIAFTSSTVNTLLTTVYNSLYNYNNNTSFQDYYEDYYSITASRYKYLNELAKEIRGNILNSAYVSSSGSGSNVSIALKAPYADLSASSHGVPDGAIAIQWNGSSQKFELVTESSGTRLVPVEDYCYPPSLWYHTNSTLSVTTKEEGIEKYYTSDKNWDAILAKYTDGKVVYSAATAAAIDLPLQYGPALFTFSFTSADGTSLKDANNADVTISNGSFPVTGIIIGEQREQSFQFHPLQGKNHYLWDSQVLSKGGDYKAYIKNGTQQPISTLVLETEKGEDVHYAVEFLNNSGRTFVGATGNILPDTKFYLIGILSLEGLTNPGIDSIFKQDCQTRATFKVTTLAKAYNTVPDLQNPQLEIGVQVHMDWILDTPSELPLF